LGAYEDIAPDQMTFFAFFWHVAGFLAPAIALAVVLWLSVRLRHGLRSTGRGAGLELGLLTSAGVMVLLAGLVYFGRDGKMATYAGLVLVQGSLAWWLRGR
jgi:hypothetical protein